MLQSWTRAQMLALGFVAAAVGSCGCAASVVVPASYSNFQAKDRTFQCEQPAGWEVISGGAPGAPSRATFKSGAAKIEIVADIMGSLFGGVSRGNDDVEPPVVAVHQLGKSKAAEELPGYEEDAPQVIQVALGEGRQSEFKAPGVRGYRATVLTNDRSVSVLARAPEANWAAIKPAFQHVIDSLAPGSRL